MILPESAAGRAASRLGLAIGAVSGTFYAFLPLLHQRHSHMDHEIRTWAQFAWALPVFLPLAPWGTWTFNTTDVLLLIHLGLVVTLIGHLLWVKATTELPIETTSILSYLQLPVTLAMNWLIIAEGLTLSMLAGATLIVAGQRAGAGLAESGGRGVGGGTVGKEASRQGDKAQRPRRVTEF